MRRSRRQKVIHNQLLMNALTEFFAGFAGTALLCPPTCTYIQIWSFILFITGVDSFRDTRIILSWSSHLPSSLANHRFFRGLLTWYYDDTRCEIMIFTMIMNIITIGIPYRFIYLALEKCFYLKSMDESKFIRYLSRIDK